MLIISLPFDSRPFFRIRALPHVGVHHYPADIEDAEAVHELTAARTGGGGSDRIEDEM